MLDHSSAIAPNPPRVGQQSAGTALMIGRGLPGSTDRLRQTHSSVVNCIPSLFDAAMLDQIRPTTVAFPLICDKLDAVQVVSRLARIGYDGLAVIFTPPLPNRKMVERELGALAPSLSIRLVESA